MSDSEGEKTPSKSRGLTRRRKSGRARHDGRPSRTSLLLLKAHQGSGYKALVLKASFTRGIGFPLVMAIAFSSFLRLGDLSKMYNLDVRWINKIPELHRCDYVGDQDSIRRSLTRGVCSFRREARGGCWFGQSGVSSRAAQRSSWHVLVSQQHVSLVTKDAQGRNASGG